MGEACHKSKDCFPLHITAARTGEVDLTRYLAFEKA